MNFVELFADPFTGTGPTPLDPAHWGLYTGTETLDILNNEAVANADSFNDGNYQLLALPDDQWGSTDVDVFDLSDSNREMLMLIGTANAAGTTVLSGFIGLQLAYSVDQTEVQVSNWKSGKVVNTASNMASFVQPHRDFVHKRGLRGS